MKNFLKVFTILSKRQMVKCSFIIFLMFLVAVLEAFGIGLLYPLINIIGNPDFLIEHKKIADFLLYFGIQSHQSLIFFSSLSLLAFYILKNFLFLYEGKLQISFSLNNQKDYSKRLYSLYIYRPYLFHLDTNLGILQRNISYGGVVVFSEILINTLSIITDIVTILVIWIFLLIIGPITSLGIALIIAPLIFLILNSFRKKISYFGNIQNATSAEMNKWINQGFSSIKETKVMQREKFFTNEFHKSYEKYSESNKEYLFINRFPRSIIELFTIGGILLLIAVKMFLKSDPSKLIATLGVLALAAMRLMPSLNRIISLFNTNKFKMPLFNELYDDLLYVKHNKDMAESNNNPEEKKEISFENQISINNLIFSYPNNKNKKILDNVNVTIPKGSFCGIIGPSGAGKTTFVDILLGLLPPDSGEILVDNVNVLSNLQNWLDKIGYVPQSIYLIDGTLKENITFGVDEEKIDEERLLRVVRMAELYDFISNLPDGLNTSVGDRGTKLSGGQKQRIGIARALYTNPSILVLDEATSALDNETEKSITETILKLKGSITIISIAHRLSTLQDCDFKIYFDKGKAKIMENK